MRKKIIAYISVIIITTVITKPSFAQCININASPPISVCGPLTPGPGGTFPSPSELVTRFLKYAIPASGFLLFLAVVFSGFQMLTSIGDEKALSAAKARLTYAIVGFLIVFVSFWLVQLVGIIFNIEEFKYLFGTP